MEAEVPASLQAALPAGADSLVAPDTIADAHELTAPGAYLLLIGLEGPVTVKAAAFPETTLAPGWYIYAGSAHGPGGLRARIARHFRADKPVRWHVDQVSTRAAGLAAAAYRNASECALVDRLLDARGFTVPAPGFGSSDCRLCTAHLLAWSARR